MRFGRYQLVGRIATDVWAAQLRGAEDLCRPLVVKRALPRHVLRKEARVAIRLAHPNLCQVFELGEVDGELYVAAEYLRGASLARLLREGGRLSPSLAVALVAQACGGLHHAHASALVHGDVTPENLFATVDGYVKILDLGTAALDGTPGYRSPEQAAAQPLDRRSDVWSLGVVLWELLTGRRLFTGTPAQIIDAMRASRVPSLRSQGVDPGGLDAVLARAICPRAQRYATAAELREAIVRAIAPRPLASTTQLSELVWSRSGERVRTHDHCFGADLAPARSVA